MTSAFTSLVGFKGQADCSLQMKDEDLMIADSSMPFVNCRSKLQYLHQRMQIGDFSLKFADN